MIYYELLGDGTVGRYTNSRQIAEQRGYYDANHVAESEPIPYKGKYYLKEDYDAIDKSEDKLAAIRTQRDALLTDSDWTQLADSPLAAERKAEWAIYRQALRDMPASITDLDDPKWPTEPST